MDNIAVILTCHEAYLKWLSQAMESINSQFPEPAERIAVFDRCKPPVNNDKRWRFIEGDWGHPSGARNAGVEATTSPWLVFWDADNVMTKGYLAAMRRAIDIAEPDVGIIYPDIQYCDKHLAPRHYWSMPAWDYWGMRAENCIDTASAWRREAVEVAGGWSYRAGAFEDYALALDITSLGWKAVKVNGPPVMMRIHSEGRVLEQQHNGEILINLFKARSLAIVSLLAGRDDTFGGWVNFLLNAELPQRTALYVVDNSGRSEFTQMAFAECQRIAAVRGFSHVSFSSFGHPYHPAPIEPYLTKGRHLHVARMYSSVFPRVAEDMVLTLEDDVEPPMDAVRRLGEEIGYRSRGNIGAVAAAYTMPQNENEICAGLGDVQKRSWGTPISWKNLPKEPFDVGCVGGGCTIWANWAIRNLPVHLWWNEFLGWDGVLSIELRRKGYRIRVHGGIRCRHHIHGNIKN